MRNQHRSQTKNLGLNLKTYFGTASTFYINKDWSEIPVATVTSLGSDLSSSVMCDNNTLYPGPYVFGFHCISRVDRDGLILQWYGELENIITSLKNFKYNI